jgi:hypothetical protein
MDNTIQDLVAKMLKLPEDELAAMEHNDLLMARKVAGEKNVEAQDKLAGAEHRAFAREYVSENPLAAPGVALMTMLYQPYKILKGQSRSNAGMDQMIQGLTGVKEGVQKALKL